MRREKISLLVLLLALTFSVSCSRLGAPGDNTITTDIKAKMFSDPSLKTAGVDVSTKGGVVTLSGQVPDDAARLNAYKIAAQTKGVTKVNDQMSVATAQTEPAPPVESEPAPVPAPEPERRAEKPRHSGSRETRQRDKYSNSQPPVVSTDPMVAEEAARNGGTSPEAPAAPAAPPGAPAPPPPPQPVTVTVPANTIVTVRTIDSVDSATNQTGQIFKASLDAPIVVNDRVVVPRGANAYMKLVNAKSAGKFSGRSELTLALSSIVFQGKRYSVESSDVNESGKSRGKQSAERVGGGAVLGALIGAIAGGGKGAAIGAAVGGGAGSGVQVFTHGEQVKIPSETRLDFTLEQPFDITYIPGKHSQRSSNGDRPPSN